MAQHTSNLRARLRKAPEVYDREPDLTPAQRRAKVLYQEVVDRIGGFLPSARVEGIDESTVRARIYNRRKHPPLSAAYSGGAEAARRYAEDLLDWADELEGIRHAG